jgi:hypothetical protein
MWHGRFQELEQENVELVHLKRETGVPITYELIKYKVQHHFKASAR